MTPALVLVGELNPYGVDPRHALYDHPPGASGDRLRTVVLGVPRAVYFSFARHNLCAGVWSAADAKTEAARLRTRYPSTPIVMLGRKVAKAFGYDGPAYTRDGLLVAIPHPSGLCREWNDPEAVPRVRALLAEVAPGVRFGVFGSTS